ncbi:MAG: hypothetical protein KDC92_17365, partial [Bacteroidetes bacterium]|nr:hypothetical protein [Bacteroidota bacterium]
MALFFNESQATETLSIKRICNEEGSTEYSLTIKANKACNGILTQFTVWAKLNGATSYEQVGGVLSITDYGKCYVINVSGKVGYESFYLVGNASCLGEPGNSDTVLVDLFKPADVSIYLASVINGEIIISWKESNDVDVKGYEVYRVDEQLTSFPIDEVDKTKLTYVLDKDQYDPTKGTMNIRLAAIDSCDQKGKPAGQATTIFLEKVSDNPCENTLQIKWNDYVGVDWNLNYQVITVLDEDDNEISTTPLSSGVNSFNVKDLPEGIYNIRIEQTEKDGLRTTWSNEIEVNRTAELQLDTFMINAVNIIDNKEIEVVWMSSATEVVESYSLYELFDGKTNLLSTEKHKENDWYTYRKEWRGGVEKFIVKANGKCGGDLTTDTAQNMLLKGEILDTNNRELRATSFLKWPNGVEKYSVQLLQNGSWQRLGLMSSDLRFNDSKYWLDVDSGLCYRVVA